RVDQPHPLGLFGRDQAESELDLVMIVGMAAADPVASVRVTRSRPVGAFIEDEHEGAVGKAAIDAEGIDLAHSFDPEAAGTALIGERTVDEAVGNYPFPYFERRTNGLLDMIGPSGGKEERFGLSAPTIFRSAE